MRTPDSVVSVDDLAGRAARLLHCGWSWERSDLGGLVVLAEQPAEHVDFVNHGVLDRHRGGEARCVIVAVNAVQHERLTVLAGVR